MKTFIVYINGNEQKEMIKARNHNSAEMKAWKKYSDVCIFYITVAYTEV